MLSAFPSIARGLNELGINNDGLGTTSIAGGMDLSRPLSPQLEAVLRMANEHTYRRFVDIVADGRKMSPEKVEARLSLSPDTLLGKALSGAHMLYLPPEPLTLLGRLQDPRSQYAICTVCAVF